MDEIKEKLREVGTPQEQIEAVSIFLMVLCDNDARKACRELEKFKNNN